MRQPARGHYDVVHYLCGEVARGTMGNRPHSHVQVISRTAVQSHLASESTKYGKYMKLRTELTGEANLSSYKPI